MAKEKILVVGGGFGGVKAALELAEEDRFAVTLLSNDDELRYYPTLFHTATGGQRATSSIPLARIFEGKPVTIAEGTAKKLDRKSKTLATAAGESYSYDTLVISLGVVTNYFGIEGMKEHSFGIKSQAEALRLKKHLHRQIIEEGHPDPHYVIVGAGATGIEIAGMLPSYLKYIMKNHGLKPRKPHVDLIEAAPRLLPRLSKKTSRLVRRRLRRLGIKLYIGKAVEALGDNELTVSGKPVRSHTVIWTAGVTNHPFFKENGFVLMNHGKVAVDTYLQADDSIFVIGDNANTPYSGTAQTALHDGAFVAKNISRRSAGKQMKSYVAKQPITVIPAGRRWAVVLWRRFTIHGRRGWLIRQAADFMGFRDLESWPRAARQFMTEFRTEDDCKVCAAANK